MKAYFFLAVAALWLTIAIVAGRTGFSVFWPKGAISFASVEVISRWMVPLLFFGWLAPTALGLWLLSTKK
jgi:hypothetical protein